jgi:hypothetical protein
LSSLDIAYLKKSLIFDVVALSLTKIICRIKKTVHYTTHRMKCYNFSITGTVTVAFLFRERTSALSREALYDALCYTLFKINCLHIADGAKKNSTKNLFLKEAILAVETQMNFMRGELLLWSISGATDMAIYNGQAMSSSG